MPVTKIALITDNSLPLPQPLAETDTIVYFNSILSNANHPLDRGDVGKQMNKLLKKFE